MKKFAFILLLMSATAYGSYSKSQYVTFRTVKAAEDTQLTATTQKTAPDATDDGTVKIEVLDEDVGIIHVIFIGTAAADKMLSWTLWAYKSVSDPAEYVANGTATTGATQTGNANEYYCDTIVITAQSWLTPIVVIDGAPDAIVNGGGIAKLKVNSCEYKYFKIIIRDIAGGGAEASTAGAKIATFVSNTSSSDIKVESLTALDIRDLTSASDTILVYGSDDGGTTKRVIKTDSGGALVSSVSKTIAPVDAWSAVTAGTIDVGATTDLSNYSNVTFNIEIAMIEAVAHDGCQGWVEVSNDGNNWNVLYSVTGTAETVATTTIVGTVADSNTAIRLTDATTGDFDINGRKWFIKDGTIANSEAVRTKSQSTNVVTLFQHVYTGHATGTNVYDRVDDWIISIPQATKYARFVTNNVDADCDVARHTWIERKE